MTRPLIDAEVIGELRLRVIRHNEVGRGPKTRLEELKRVYRQGWRGQKPRAAAMNHVDRYLKRLARPVLSTGVPSPTTSGSTQGLQDVEAEMSAGPAEGPGRA
ncbi:hypothetical protein [Roseomonas mucosa]|uniref:hypothetical protein n=1 Tax=Roseomonas mucosa TaxID=207340 RepID=UPI0028CCB5F1|nr:hypothetical protein [Roseomonas mucosa]MDT8351886.1 hypothetical protein [Roseomonas mucosa]